MDIVLRFNFLLISYACVNDFILTASGQLLQPHPADLRKVFFRLWTPESGSSVSFIFYNESNIQALLDHNFKPTRATKIIIHGWYDNTRRHAQKFAAGRYISDNYTRLL